MSRRGFKGVVTGKLSDRQIASYSEVMDWLEHGADFHLGINRINDPYLILFFNIPSQPIINYLLQHASNKVGDIGCPYIEIERVASQYKDSKRHESVTCMFTHGGEEFPQSIQFRNSARHHWATIGIGPNDATDLTHGCYSNHCHKYRKPFNFLPEDLAKGYKIIGSNQPLEINHDAKILDFTRNKFGNHTGIGVRITILTEPYWYKTNNGDDVYQNSGAKIVAETRISKRALYRMWEELHNKE